MTKFEEKKQFLKEHKKEILIGIGTTVIGGLTIVTLGKKLKGLNAEDIRKALLPKLVKFDIPDELASRGITELSSCNPEKYIDIWCDTVPLSELGRVGKELSKCLNVDLETGISGVIGITR